MVIIIKALRSLNLIVLQSDDRHGKDSDKPPRLKDKKIMLLFSLIK